VLARLNLATSEVIALVRKRRTSKAFLAFLKAVVKDTHKNGAASFWRAAQDERIVIFFSRFFS
jgi:hypothetical protein